MLEQIADEMKAIAKADKLDIKSNHCPSAERSTRRVAVGDVLCHILFTCDVISNREFWHLSMSTIPYGTVPLETAEVVKKAFFGDKAVEMPSFFHGDNMKQYLCEVA